MRSSSSSSTTVRDDDSVDAAPQGVPGHPHHRRRPKTSATRAVRTSESRRRARRSSPSSIPISRSTPGTAKAMLARFERELGHRRDADRRSAISTAPTIRRRAGFRRRSLATAHGLLGLWWPTNPFTARYRQLNADPSVSRDRRLGVGRGDLATPRRARRDRRLGRALLHVHGGPRPVLALATRGMADCLRTGRRNRPRAGRSTSKHPYRMLVAAPSLGVAVRPRRIYRCSCCALAVRGCLPDVSRRVGDGRARLACVRAGPARG